MKTQILYLAMLLWSLLLCACGDLGPSPAADGARFSRSFRYYYVEECRYDRLGTYDCGLVASVSPSYHASLRIDSDGMATLRLDGASYYYFESEYDEGHDNYGGGFYQFYENDGEVTLYKDGSELIFWNTWDNTATVYSYDLPY